MNRHLDTFRIAEGAARRRLEQELEQVEEELRNVERAILAGIVCEPAWKAQGAQVFGNYCSACHQLTGQGLPGVFPPLAGSATVKSKDPSEHVRTVLHGLHGKTIAGVAYPAVMPPFGPQLTDAEVAAVVNHERSSWGNNAPLVQPEDVAGARRESSPAQAKDSAR